MEKFILYGKLSKKEKRKLDQAKRKTWGDLNPVTRKSANSRAYNRRKAQDWKRESPPDPVSFYIRLTFPFLRSIIPLFAFEENGFRRIDTAGAAGAFADHPEAQWTAETISIKIKQVIGGLCIAMHEGKFLHSR